MTHAERIAQLERSNAELRRALEETAMRLDVLLTRGDLSSNDEDEKITRGWLKRVRAALSLDTGAGVEMEWRLGREGSSLPILMQSEKAADDWIANYPGNAYRKQYRVPAGPWLEKEPPIPEDTHANV